jgi:hypothetical protein
VYNAAHAAKDSVLQKTKKLLKLGGIVESVVSPCIMGNVMPGTTLSEHTRTSPESMYKVSDSCVSQFMHKVFQQFSGQ